LKGAAATIGGRRLAALAGELEVAGRSGDLATAPTVVSAIRECHELLGAALQAHRTEPRDGGHDGH
jgi:HPt (histidine-containing phosphotransfer) domain-containing protein